MYNSPHDHIAVRDMPTFIIHAHFADMESLFFRNFSHFFLTRKAAKVSLNPIGGERNLIFHFIRLYFAHLLFKNMTQTAVQSNVPVMPIKALLTLKKKTPT